MADHDWAFYLTEVNDKIASILLDLSLRGSVPDAANPQLLCCSVAMKNPREDGLSSSEEFEALNKMEDGFTAAVAALAVSAGRITTGGHRDFFYYCSDPAQVEAAIRKAISEHSSGYEIEFDASADEDWGFYLNVLYPSDEEMQVIQNERTVAALAEQGDLHDVPRPISHWAYFRTPEDRQAFIASSIAAGFRLEDEFEVESGDLGVELERNDRIDDIDEATLTLFRLAGQHNGDYDGWESVVVLTDALPS